MSPAESPPIRIVDVERVVSGCWRARERPDEVDEDMEPVVQCLLMGRSLIRLLECGGEDAADNDPLRTDEGPDGSTKEAQTHQSPG